MLTLDLSVPCARGIHLLYLDGIHGSSAQTVRRLSVLKGYVRAHAEHCLYRIPHQARSHRRAVQSPLAVGARPNRAASHICMVSARRRHRVPTHHGAALAACSGRGSLARGDPARRRPRTHVSSRATPSCKPACSSAHSSNQVCSPATQRSALLHPRYNILGLLGRYWNVSTSGTRQRRLDSAKPGGSRYRTSHAENRGAAECAIPELRDDW